jgi:hypothetical protein
MNIACINIIESCSTADVKNAIFVDSLKIKNAIFVDALKKQVKSGVEKISLSLFYVSSLLLGKRIIILQLYVSTIYCKGLASLP